MKRIALPLVALVALFLAASVYAGGKECQAKAAKSVELTGTLQRAAAGSHDKAVFRTADGHSYTVCEQTKASALKQATDANTSVRVKGKVVNCGGSEELIIESASKI